MYQIFQCFKRAWPGISRSVFGDHSRYIKTYFAPFPGYFFTGDGARRDADGYLWITGVVLHCLCLEIPSTKFEVSQV